MSSWTRKIAAIFFAALPLVSHGACFSEAAKRYSVPEELLRAISIVESGGRSDATNTNSNGTTDIGHMQINSAWLPTLAQFNITEKELRDPCINTNVGAWILAGNIARLGFNWNAVGAYNAATPSKRVVYAKKIAKQLLSVKQNDLIASAK